MRHKDIKRPAWIKGTVNRAAALRPIRKTRAHCSACSFQRSRQRPKRLRDQSFKPLTQRLGKPSRRAASANRNEYGITVNNRWQCEITQAGPVNRVDENAARFQPDNCGLRLYLILKRDNRKRSYAVFTDNLRPSALKQRAFGRSCVTIAKQDHRATLQTHKKRQAVHQPFTRHSL
jgi:hypothetical protein